MDYFDIARQCIEDFVAGRKDWAHLTKLRWIDKKPDTDLLYALPAWLADVQAIIDDYNSRIDVRVSLTSLEKKNSHALALGKLWQLLVRKAETRSRNTVIKAFNS